MKSRQVVIASKIKGFPTEANFRIDEVELPALNDGGNVYDMIKWKSTETVVLEEFFFFQLWRNANDNNDSSDDLQLTWYKTYSTTVLVLKLCFVVMLY